MNKFKMYLFLVFIPLFAMESDDPPIYICSSGAEGIDVVAILPLKIAYACQTIRSSLEFKGKELSVPLDFASPALWKKLKPCMEYASSLPSSHAKKNLQELLECDQDLASIISAANYFGHDALFKYCVDEWANRSDIDASAYSFPQEVEGAIAHAILAKHNLPNKLISCCIEKISLPIKKFRCRNKAVVWTCAIGQQGKSVAAGLIDGTIQYWVKKEKEWQLKTILNAHDVREGQEILEETPIGRLLFIDNDTKLISSGELKGIKLWDLAAATCIKSFGDVECNGFFFAYDPVRQLVAISTKDFGINIYNLDTHDVSVKLRLLGHKDIIRALDFNPHQNKLASVGDDRELFLWDLTTGENIRNLSLPHKARSVSFNHAGTQVAVGINDGYLQIYDSAKAELLAVQPRDQFVGHKGVIWACCFSQDDSVLMTGSEDRKIIVWALPELDSLKIIDGDWGGILFMDFHSGLGGLLAGFCNGSLGLTKIGHLLQAIQEERNVLKYGMDIERAQFLAKVAQATKEQPLACTGEAGKILNSFNPEFRDQLINNFCIWVPSLGDGCSPREKRSIKVKKIGVKGSK